MNFALTIARILSSGLIEKEAPLIVSKSSGRGPGSLEQRFIG